MAAATTATTKPATKKLSKGTKKASPSKASHPTYFQMIKDGFLDLKEKSGSSPYAIAKYMEEHHKADLLANFKIILGHQLKNFITKGRLIKVKASFKLSDVAKKEKAPEPATEKKPKAPKAIEKKPKVAEKKPVKADTSKKKKKATTAKPVKKALVKKSIKSTPVKRRAPKSIKSPISKKAKKA